MKVPNLALVLLLGVPLLPQDASFARSNKAAALKYATQPLAFEPNLGQIDPQVKYASRGSAYGLFFTQTEAVFSFAGKDAKTKQERRADLRMRFAGGNPKASIEPADPLPSKSNFFIGNDSKRWRTDVPNYARVRYRSVYPGVDVVFYGNQRQIEYDLVLSPGADPHRIRLQFDGVKRIQTAENGDLAFVTPAGTLLQRKPLVYQKLASGRREIESHYAVHGNEVEFQVAQYDTAQPLVIDPIFIVYDRYLGGSNGDAATGEATDANGNLYVVGYTSSTDFPTLNAFQGSIASPGTPPSTPDAFITKFNSTGALVYSTYLGGSNTDQANAVAVDGSGNVYITGLTASGNFPRSASPLQNSLLGGNNAFVTKLNSTGNGLIYSTYLGGSRFDQGRGIAVDGSGNAYITGFTNSPDFAGSITAQQMPIQGTKGGGTDSTQDAWIAKINATGSQLIFATFLGGTSDDEANGIAVDSSGNVYVTGWTQSSEASFPLKNALQATYAGNTDAFVTKISTSGNPATIVYSTFLGGGSVDQADGIAVDSANPPNVYVAGLTQSSDFHHEHGLFTTRNGPQDAFVTKINGSGSAITWSSFLGGSGNEEARSISVDSAGNAYVTGQTTSSANDFPLANAMQSTFGGNEDDAFISEFKADGTALLFSTYLGGNGDDVPLAIAVNAQGRFFVAGLTTSANFPNTSNSYGGLVDAFVVAFARTSAIGIFRTGLWVVDLNGNFQWDGIPPDEAFFLGQGGDVAVVGDWNGDGRKKAGIFRNGLWVLDYNGNGQWDGPGIDRVYNLGQAGDVPVVGDWNGTGFDKIGVFRNGLWVIDYNGNGQWDGPGAPANPNVDLFTFLGQSGDVPVVGDWNKSGKTKIGIFRNGLWVLDYNGNYQWDGPGAPGNPSLDVVANLGQTGDVPVVGDWNGSGWSKLGIFRNGLWVIDYNGNFQWDGPGAPGNPNVDLFTFLGQSGDVPVVGDWNGSGWTKIGIFRNGLWVIDYNGNFQWDGPGAPGNPNVDLFTFLGQSGDVPLVGRW